MLVTDSLSYIPIPKNEEINAAIENMMRDGLLSYFLTNDLLMQYLTNLKI
jgi:hypothetical protein